MRHVSYGENGVIMEARCGDGRWDGTGKRVWLGGVSLGGESAAGALWPFSVFCNANYTHCSSRGLSFEAHLSSLQTSLSITVSPTPLQTWELVSRALSQIFPISTDLYIACALAHVSDGRRVVAEDRAAICRHIDPTAVCATDVVDPIVLTPPPL